MAAPFTMTKVARPSLAARFKITDRAAALAIPPALFTTKRRSSQQRPFPTVYLTPIQPLEKSAQGVPFTTPTATSVILGCRFQNNSCSGAVFWLRCWRSITMPATPSFKTVSSTAIPPAVDTQARGGAIYNYRQQPLHHQLHLCVQ